MGWGSMHPYFSISDTDIAGINKYRIENYSIVEDSPTQRLYAITKLKDTDVNIKVWIDKQNHRLMRYQSFDREGNLVKELTFVY